jgi:hypothetical protein
MGKFGAVGGRNESLGDCHTRGRNAQWTEREKASRRTQKFTTRFPKTRKPDAASIFSPIPSDTFFARFKIKS